MTLPLVLLGNPRVAKPRNARLPLSLLALAAGLAARARVRIVDGNFEDDAVATVLAAIGAERPALVGVTVKPGPQLAPAIAVSRAVRERHPSVPIVWSGYFPTLYADAALAAPYVDVVVRGPGEATLVELLEAFAGGREPASVAGIGWRDRGRAVLHCWCYARPDALAGFAPRTWELVMRSGLRMVFMGAEASSDEALRRMHKGTRVDETIEATRRCREAGIVPELSFVLGGPGDPEAEVERTFQLIRRLKGIHPGCEVVLYFWTPAPRRRPSRSAEDDGIALPTTPEERAEPGRVDIVCHRNAPWLSPRMRRRIDDFATVLGCRFPTVQDVRLPRRGKAVLSAAAAWRWTTGTWVRPGELRALRRALPLKRPEAEGL